MMPHYHINLFWSGEGGCWIADVSDLRYCSAHGETPDEAVGKIRIAINLHLERCIAHGAPS